MFVPFSANARLETLNKHQSNTINYPILVFVSFASVVSFVSLVSPSSPARPPPSLPYTQNRDEQGCGGARLARVPVSQRSPGVDQVVARVPARGRPAAVLDLRVRDAVSPGAGRRKGARGGGVGSCMIHGAPMPPSYS